jgi:chemotaxis protein methyltransferase CheR
MMQELTDTEVDEIILLLKRQYGYDFANYSMASFKRRVRRVMDINHLNDFYSLKYAVLNEKSFEAQLLENITVNVTEMFRDPHFYKLLAEKVLPVLGSYPTIKIWHAGCSTGEEVFSLGILLHEAGLLKRCRIYATDVNPGNIEKAAQGIISARMMKDYTQNYVKAGGKSDFSSYYTARYEHAIVRRDLRERIVFSQHNLVSDEVFNEFQLVCCRNVLIYFNRILQNRVLNLFYNSLAPLGYLALGTKESLLFADVRENFDTIDGAAKIFRRKD